MPKPKYKPYSTAHHQTHWRVDLFINTTVPLVPLHRMTISLAKGQLPTFVEKLSTTIC